MMRKLIDDVSDIKAGQKIYEQEINYLKEENKNLKTRIKALEIRVQHLQGKEKKNNIVIKGIPMNKQVLKQGVEQFLKQELGGLK